MSQWAPNPSSKGILIGCDSRQEWLLKWWWENYSKHNYFPVTFIDFGMSKSAHIWCKKKGTVISLSVEDLSSCIAQQSWAKTTTPYAFSKRNIWFAKILALLKTPYKKTLWLDLDCQVKNSLHSLFAYCEKEEDVALCLELKERAQAEQNFSLIPLHAKSYNSGVIVFNHQSPLITRWAQKALSNHAQFFADQQLLDTIIHQENYKVIELPSIYNQIHPKPDHKDVIIYHHASFSGQLGLLENYSL